MQLLNLTIISAIFITIIVVISTLFIKDIVKTLNRFCNMCRWFISENAGIFKIIFIITFFLEQVAFIYILNKYFNISKSTNTFIGIFALIVVTTASFQAFIWEYKYYHSEQQLRMVKYMNLLAQKSESLIDKFTNKFRDILKKK
jgi:hypothetical protein